MVPTRALSTRTLPAGHWRRALTAFEQMKVHNCRPDSVVYNTIVGALWRTGLVWAQVGRPRIAWLACAGTLLLLLPPPPRPVHAPPATPLPPPPHPPQAKAMQIFHAACRQGHFRITVHTLDATAAVSAAASAASTAAGSPTVAAAALAAPAALGSGATSGSGSRADSPALSMPPAIAAPHAALGATPELCSPALPSTPALPGTPLSALAVAMAAGSPSPSGSPLCDANLAAAAAATLASASAAPAAGTGAGTVIEFGMHAFTVGSAVLSLLRWVAELRERLPREPNKDLRQQVCVWVFGGGGGRGPAVRLALGYPPPSKARRGGLQACRAVRTACELFLTCPAHTCSVPHPTNPVHQVCLVLNKGKPSREHTYPAIRAALCSLLRAWASPFTLTDIPQGCRIQATACDITGGRPARGVRLAPPWPGLPPEQQWARPAAGRCASTAMTCGLCASPSHPHPPHRLAALPRGRPRAGRLQRPRRRRARPPGQGGLLPAGRRRRGGGRARPAAAEMGPLPGCFRQGCLA